MTRALTLSILGLALLHLGCSSTSPTATAAAEGAAGSAPAGVSEAPPPPPPPPLEFQEGRRYSPERYAVMAKKLVPVGASVERAAASFIETRLAAIELDFFEDDWLYRDGAMVLLGEERGRVVALTQRYYADIRYPDPRLIADGFGAAEIGAQHIDVYERRDACKPRSSPGCEVHRFRVESRGRESLDVSAVEAKSFDDHDITLLYFHKRSPIVAGRPTMGIERPTEVVERHIREAETLFGMHFNLISDMSLAEMKRNIRVDSAGNTLLTMATGMLLGPIVGRLTGELASRVSLPQEVVQKVEAAVKKELGKRLAAGAEAFIDELEGDSEPAGRFTLAPGLAAVACVPELLLSEEVLSPAGGLVLTTPEGANVEVALAGITRPGVDRERARLASYLKGIAGDGMAKVDLRGDDDVVRSMIVIPGEKVNLNFELLRHGLVRLDLEDALALRTFPELREAAAAALETETGFAREWRDDSEYARGTAEVGGQPAAAITEAELLAEIAALEEAAEVAEVAESESGC